MKGLVLLRNLIPNAYAGGSLECASQLELQNSGSDATEENCEAL